jgi:hypothetical protein
LNAAFLVDRPSGRECINLLVHPVPTRTQQQGISPMALIHLVDPAQPRVKMVHATTSLFKLTSAKARIGAFITNGQSIQDIALTTPAAPSW